MDEEREDTEILTLEEAARHLQLKPRTLLTYAYAGCDRIPFHKKTIIPTRNSPPKVACTFLKRVLDKYDANKKQRGRPRGKKSKGRRDKIFGTEHPEYAKNIDRLKHFLNETDLSLQDMGKEFNGLSREAIRVAGIRAGIYSGEKGRRARRAQKKREQALLSSLAVENLPWWYRAVQDECFRRKILFEPCYKESGENLIIDHSKVQLGEKIIHLKHTDRAHHKSTYGRVPYSSIHIGTVRSNEFLCIVQKWKNAVRIFIFPREYIAQKTMVELPTERKISHRSGAQLDSRSKLWDFEGDKGWAFITDSHKKSAP
ncbi:MAG: hypothetical protein G01um101433_178 [Parcubacteria group bacterium Gr01-1014_33]|nr:MAG: hypothetical protein G01um101433_178 [Parcubacteria group bacterium Gr01-1014_33]